MPTALKLDHAEAEVLTGLTDVHAAAHQIAAYGPREVMLTHNGGVLVYAGEEACEATFASLNGRSHRAGRHLLCYLPGQAAVRTA